ncbi:MAG: hypothetical protein ACYDEN_14420 [Acidimicrobiales bacterium]
MPRIKDTGIRQFSGLVCPDCHRHRFLPQLVIEGIVPEADLHHPAGSAAGGEEPGRWPFKVIGTAS